MFDLFATVLAWFYSFTHNYALAIALLTLSVMVILTPLTLKGTKSMLQLQRLQPEMRRIQQQYKGDRQKLNEELMKFYQEHKISPLGGCLPLLLQAPVFIVLYRVLHKLTADTNGDGFFDPSYLHHDTALYQDLSQSTQMVSFGIDLSRSAVQKLGESFVEGIPYLILILLVTGTSYYQQRQISARTVGQADTPMLRQQRMLMKVFPVFFAVISLTLPAGLVVYFLVSNSYRIAQQAYITRTFYRHEHSLGRQAQAAAAAARAEDGDKGGKGPKEVRDAKSREVPKGPAGAKGAGAKGQGAGAKGQSGAAKAQGGGRAARPASDAKASSRAQASNPKGTPRAAGTPAPSGGGDDTTATANGAGSGGEDSAGRPPPTPRPTPKGRPAPSGRVTPPRPKPAGRPAPSRPQPKKK